MKKEASFMQADAAVFIRLQAENATLKKENVMPRQKLERMNDLLRLFADRRSYC